MSAIVRRVIEVTITRGAGILPDDPFREVIQYWSADEGDGALLAERDPHHNNILAEHALRKHIAAHAEAAQADVKARYKPQPGSCGGKVLEYLRTNGCNTPAAIAKAIGAPYGRTSSAIDYLVRRGVLEQHPGSRGIYQMVGR